MCGNICGINKMSKQTTLQKDIFYQVPRLYLKKIVKRDISKLYHSRPILDTDY